MNQPAATQTPHVDAYLGVDAGATWIRVAITDRYGNLQQNTTVPAGDPGDEATRIAAALRRACDGWRILAGAATDTPGIDGWRNAGLGRIPFTTMAPAALAAGPGRTTSVVISAGTNAEVTSTFQGIEQTRVEMKDAGGLWFGHQAIEAVAAANIGDGPPTLLCDLVGETISRRGLDTTRDRDVATLATSVEQAARDGDDVAGSICEQAARALIDAAVPFLTGADHDVVTHGAVVAPTTVTGTVLRSLLTQRGIHQIRHTSSVEHVAAQWAAHNHT